jgi:4-azaleucine resistance transporter AzlC
VSTSDVADTVVPDHGFVAVAREVGVVWASLFALGLGFGVVVVAHGFPWWFAPIMSATMFAGSVEYILIGMMAVEAPVATLALTTFLVNSRHAFYGLTFPLHKVRGRLAKAYSIFALCDEAFVLLTTRNEDELTPKRMLWTQVGLHAGWASGSLAGAVAGSSLLAGIQGFDFVLTALFVVLTIDAYRENPDPVALVLAIGAAAIAELLAPSSMLLVALSLYTMALLVRARRQRRTGSRA